MYTAIVLANIMLLTSGLIQIEPYKQQILDVHNNFRRQLKATNMNKLVCITMVVRFYIYWALIRGGMYWARGPECQGPIQLTEPVHMKIHMTRLMNFKQEVDLKRSNTTFRYWDGPKSY